MKNLNTMKKAELIEMVKELQAKVEELTRVPEPEEKQYSVDYVEWLEYRTKELELQLKYYEARYSDEVEDMLDDLTTSELTFRDEELLKKATTLEGTEKAEDAAHNKKHEDIMSNHRVIGKPMSDDQLRAVLKQVAYYEITLPENFCTFTVVQVSELIQTLSTMIKQGEVVKRKGHYNPDDLYQRFLQKYPEACDNIVNRNM